MNHMFFLIRSVAIVFLQGVGGVYNLKAQENHDTLFIKDIRQYEYCVDNKNSRSFGYHQPEAAYPYEINNIQIMGNYLYVADGYHCNIKIVNTHTGVIENVSKKFSVNNIDKPWGNLIFFNHKFIWLLENGSYFYILDSNLNNWQKITLPYYSTEQRFFYKDQDSLSIIFSISLNSLNELKNENENYRAVLLMDKVLNYGYDTVVLNTKDLMRPRINGKVIEYFKNKKNDYCKFDNFIYEMPKIPEIPYYYWWYYSDINDKMLAFIYRSENDKKYILNICYY